MDVSDVCSFFCVWLCTREGEEESEACGDGSGVIERIGVVWSSPSEEVGSGVGAGRARARGGDQYSFCEARNTHHVIAHDHGLFTLDAFFAHYLVATFT